MPRRFGALLLCAVVMLVVVGTIYTAPAPLPKKEKEQTLFQQVRKLVHAHDGRLYDMRPGPKSDEWILIISSVHATSGTLDTGPIPVKRLTDPDIIQLLVDLAEIEEEQNKLPPDKRLERCGGKLIRRHPFDGR